VSFQASPIYLPNFPIEHDSVILVVNLATHVVAEILTQVLVVFVSVSFQVFVFLVQALLSREVPVRAAPRE